MCFSVLVSDLRPRVEKLLLKGESCKFTESEQFFKIGLFAQFRQTLSPGQTLDQLGGSWTNSQSAASVCVLILLRKRPVLVNCSFNSGPVLGAQSDPELPLRLVRMSREQICRLPWGR